MTPEIASLLCFIPWIGPAIAGLYSVNTLLGLLWHKIVREYSQRVVSLAKCELQQYRGALSATTVGGLIPVGSPLYASRVSPHELESRIAHWTYYLEGAQVNQADDLALLKHQLRWLAIYLIVALAASAVNLVWFRPG
jgi:hypothetical protein